MKLRLVPVLLLVSLGFNIGLLIWVMHPKNDPTLECPLGTSSWKKSPLSRALNLTEDQTHQLETALKKLQTQIKPLQAKLSQKRSVILSLFQSNSPALDNLKSTVSEIAQLQAEIEYGCILHYLEIRPFFNPDQLQSVEHYLEKGLCPTPNCRETCTTIVNSKKGENKQ